MEQAVALMMGIIALIAGLSIFVRQKEWMSWLKYLANKGDGVALILGYMHIIIGSFILAFHWKWTGLPIIISLIGVKAVIEGAIYMLFPNSLQAILAWYEPRQKFIFSLSGVLALIISAIAFSEWLQII